MSLVVWPACTAASTARSIAAASCVQPTVSSISAADRMAPIGLATFFPASGGADPWTGSKSEVRPGWMLPDAAMPSPPCKRPADVGDDVAEQVVGDDHLVLRRDP